MKLLGFSGRALHGKDTCAGIARDIASDAGLAVGSWAFAHALKAVVYGEAAGKYTLDEVFKTKPPEVRKLLQQRGTELGRDAYGLELWTLQTEVYLDLFANYFPLDGITVTDVRFPNEVDFVRNGGIVGDVYQQRIFEQELRADIYVEEAHRYALQKRRALRNTGKGLALYIVSDRPTLTGEAAKHLSETALDHLDKRVEFDGIIDNSLGVTLSDLKEQLTPFVVRLFNL